MQVPEFDQLQIIGMAATLAVNIKGLGDIEYEVLRKVSDHFMSIPSYALKPVLEVLAEVEFIRIFKSGKTIEKITPNIPVFENVYKGLGEYADKEVKFNEHEEPGLLGRGHLGVFWMRRGVRQTFIAPVAPAPRGEPPSQRKLESRRTAGENAPGFHLSGDRPCGHD